MFSHTTKDLTKRENILQSIESQTNLVSVGGYLICFKHVNSDLSSLHDSKFKYVVGAEAVALTPVEDDSSCASGLHVSNANYWNGMGGTNSIMCRVHLDDIITVQQGKVRCRKLFVVGVCDGDVF